MSIPQELKISLFYENYLIAEASEIYIDDRDIQYIYSPRVEYSGSLKISKLYNFPHIPNLKIKNCALTMVIDDGNEKSIFDIHLKPYNLSTLKILKTIEEIDFAGHRVDYLIL